jgi:hypothetical protein
MSAHKGEDDCMSVTRMEKFVVSAIYLLMAASAARLFIAGISNPNSSRFQDLSCYSLPRWQALLRCFFQRF